MPQSRPNIMLLQCEDIGLHLSCYIGNDYAHTPNMDRIAEQGAKYNHAYTHTPVCAPSRGGMVAGCYPWSIGNHQMRSTLLNPPRNFTHELIDAGYHVSWPTKTDFNFQPQNGWCTDTEHWWEKDAPDDPFFVYVNFDETHESRMFDELVGSNQALELEPELKHDPAKAPVPPYMLDCDESRRQLVRYFDALTYIDQRVGTCLDWLDKTGQADNTIVILLSDHGRGLPREKRWCYEAGIHMPLLIRWPGHIEPGTEVDDLIAWVDIAPTLLSITGIEIPEHYQGQVFLGDHKAPAREYVYAGRDRMGLSFDHVRCVRDQRWHYIHNSFPQLPYAQHQWYMEQQPIMPVMREQHAQGKLTGDTLAFFTQTKPPEEFYDIDHDPHCLNNLIDADEHQEKIQKMRDAWHVLQTQYGDMGLIDEDELYNRAVTEEHPGITNARKVKRSLPEHQVFGPQPVPHTMNQAKKVIASM